MEMELFKTIIQKAVRHESVETVSLDAYNEPTVDSLFEERVRLVAATRLKLDLFTNGSRLSRRLLLLLRDTGVVNSLCFNLPSIRRGRFRRLTGSEDFDATMRNIDAAIGMDLNVTFSIIETDSHNGDGETEEIREMFAARLKTTIRTNRTRDRAGLLGNEFFQNVNISEARLHGCFLAVTQLNIAIDGNCFICCEDFEQKYKFGSIRDFDIDTLLNCDAAKQLRKWIFGGQPAPDDFLCRKCKEMEFLGEYTKPFLYDAPETGMSKH